MRYKENLYRPTQIKSVDQAWNWVCEPDETKPGFGLDDGVRYVKDLGEKKEESDPWHNTLLCHYMRRYAAEPQFWAAFASVEWWYPLDSLMPCIPEWVRKDPDLWLSILSSGVWNLHLILVTDEELFNSEPFVRELLSRRPEAREILEIVVRRQELEAEEEAEAEALFGDSDWEE